MPSDTARPGRRPPRGDAPDAPLHIRCFCGTSHLRVHATPQAVSYCHCRDCRRWTGAPVAAFAAFPADALARTLGPGQDFGTGSERWTCRDCGSPLAVRFDDMPGQVFVPLGVVDEADQLVPQVHSHVASALPWLHIQDDLPRNPGTSGAALRGT